jgi:UDP-N-acetylmuramyl pentapeptide phosphotransferase/UDP-N-acetylglucosamine-1-phosphate transferase
MVLNPSTLAIFVFASIASAALSALLIIVLKPLLIRYALARPNARSSHKIPTPQGGGIAILTASLLVWGFPLVLLGLSHNLFLIVGAAAIAFGVLGATDDISPLPAAPRLAWQFIVVSSVVFKPELRIFPEFVPPILEWTFLVVGGVWFVNLVNFMDGLDWITVAEMVPITAFIAILGPVGVLPIPVALLAAALCGALIGFAPFNKPIAQLFLGDVGSLSIGLLVAFLLWQLAGTGALAAALLLPLYYLMDATITLLKRLARREKVWEAHRSHFYQQATDNGFSAMAVSSHVFGLNVILAALAAGTLLWPSGGVQIASLLAGVILVGLLLRRFATPRSRPIP